MTGTERRSAPRIAATIDVQLRRKVGGPVTGRTLDLSAGGMRIHAERPLRIDEVLHFDLALGAAGDVRVMRLYPGNDYALRFEQLSTADADVISRFVALH